MTKTDFRTGTDAPSNPSASFFHMSADYLIDPASATGDLSCDLGCLHETIEEAIESVIEAAGADKRISLRAFSALYLVQQARGIAAEYIRRTAYDASSSAAAAPSLPGGDESSKDSLQALSDADCANNAVRQALDAIQGAVYSDLGPAEQGLYEAAIASTERLERAIARGLDSGARQ
jgi:hypothetical protein